jgi:glycine cleavage system T protein (aminomethyltransferase)
MLDAFFASRGVALLSVQQGVSVPRRFSDSPAEHLATRRAAGLFDFSFMGCYEISGRESLEFLGWLQTRCVTTLRSMAACYTLLCRADGTVFNDATLWNLGGGRFWLFTGRRSDFRNIAAAAGEFDVHVEDCSGRCAVLAIQGPLSALLVSRILGRDAVAALRYFQFMRLDWRGHEAWVARLGYSGELGYEVLVSADAAVDLWGVVVAAGAAEGLRECGFEAADSLRIESGYILFARELAHDVTPYELGLARLVSFDGRRFRGRAPLWHERWREPARRLCGILPGHRRISAAQDLPRARVTSEARSPVLERLLALGLVAYEASAPGTLLALEDGRVGRVARLPFYDSARILPRRPPIWL